MGICDASLRHPLSPPPKYRCRGQKVTTSNGYSVPSGALGNRLANGGRYIVGSTRRAAALARRENVNETTGDGPAVRGQGAQVLRPRLATAQVAADFGQMVWPVFGQQPVRGAAAGARSGDAAGAG